MPLEQPDLDALPELRVVRLIAENFKRLVAVDITPKGDVVKLTGRNRQGKTSILDAIWVACVGKAAAPAEPINTEAESARIVLDLGEVIITRTFRRTEDGDYTTSVKVTNAQGVRFPGGPQELLNQLYGVLSFDPLEFARKKPPEKLEVVKQLVQFDFETLAAKRKVTFESRTEVNREAEQRRKGRRRLSRDHRNGARR